MDRTLRLQAYLTDVEERIAEIMKTIARLKVVIAKSAVGSGERCNVEQQLATYHEEGRFLMGQRERVRHMLALAQEQEELSKTEVASNNDEE
jgi:hypothetical protein